MHGFGSLYWLEAQVYVGTAAATLHDSPFKPQNISAAIKFSYPSFHACMCPVLILATVYIKEQRCLSASATVQPNVPQLPANRVYLSDMGACDGVAS